MSVNDVKDLHAKPAVKIKWLHYIIILIAKELGSKTESLHLLR